MIKEEIELRKRRDFSGVLNASFAFARQEFKVLWKLIALYAGIPVLVHAILGAVYLDSTFTDVFSRLSDPAASQEFVNNMGGKGFLVNIVSLITQVFLTGLTYCYIGVYVANGAGNVDIKEVWNNFTNLFVSFIGFYLLTGIIIVLSLIALIIPAIYLMAPLSMILIVKVMEKQGYSYSFSRCFALVKNHWWQTFGLVVIIAVIVSSMAAMFALPATIIMITKGIVDGDLTANTTPLMITTVLSNIGAAIVAPLTPIVISFQYFSLVEHKENLTLLDKIDKINDQPKSEDEF